MNTQSPKRISYSVLFGVLLAVLCTQAVLAAKSDLTSPLPSYGDAQTRIDEPKNKPIPPVRKRKFSMFDIYKPRKTFNLKVNLGELPFNSIGFMPELRIADRHTFTPGVSFGKQMIDGLSHDYFTITPEYRYYVVKNKKGDFHQAYVGGYLRYKSEQNELNSKYHMVGPGFIVGTQFIAWDKITTDFFIGAGFLGIYTARYGADAPQRVPPLGDIRVGVAIGLCEE